MFFIDFVSIIVFIFIFNGQCSSAPLDDYVNKPDPNFTWKRLQTYSQPTHTLYVLNMTSQKWFDGKKNKTDR